MKIFEFAKTIFIAILIIVDKNIQTLVWVNN